MRFKKLRAILSVLVKPAITLAPIRIAASWMIALAEGFNRSSGGCANKQIALDNKGQVRLLSAGGGRCNQLIHPVSCLKIHIWKKECLTCPVNVRL